MTAAELVPTPKATSDPAPDLPPNWTPDPTLQAELPDHLDHRHFRRIVEAPTRYAVNVLGTAPYVWDLKLKRPVSPMSNGSNGKPKKRKSKARWPRWPRRSTPQAVTLRQPKHRLRLRFRLNLGPFGGVKRFLLSRLVCAAVKGAPQRSAFEANHEDGNPLNNHWRNLNWLTPAANRAIERIRPERMRTQRSGAANSNCRLSFGQLFHLIRIYDDQQTSEGDLATAFKISRAQTHRLVTEKTRHAEDNDLSRIPI